MSTFAKWWQGVGKALVGFALVVLIASSNFDAFVCAGEMAFAPGDQAQVSNPVTVQPTVVATIAQAGHDHGGQASENDRGLCIHGHCHHAGAYVASDATLIAYTSSVSQRAALPELALPVSDPKFGLKRPPRV